MQRKSVSSSNLSSVGYDEAARILEIEFHSGRIYQYSGVPDGVYRQLMSAASHGSYFAHHIKNVYPYRQVF